MADRSLDAELAEALGNEICTREQAVAHSDQMQEEGLLKVDSDSFYTYGFYIMVDRAIWLSPVPAYSTDGNAMLELIDLVIARGKKPDLDLVVVGGEGTYGAQFSYAGLNRCAAEEESLPLAVATAALAALEAEE